MNTKPILMIDVKKDCFPWVVVKSGCPIKSGVAKSLRELANVQHDEEVAGVWIDSGYGTSSVMSAAQAHGWLTFKGQRGCYGPSDMIEEMLSLPPNAPVLLPATPERSEA